MNEQLDRVDLPWERADYGASRTYETIKRPFLPRFAYWAGCNGKVLHQTERFDDKSAKAYEQGRQTAVNQNQGE